MKPNFDGIPQELKELNQWCLWKLIKKPDEEKPTKIPYQPNGKLVSTTNPKTWASYNDVYETFRKSKLYHGVGFVFSENDPYCFIDLDNCVKTTGEIEQWAMDVIQTIKSYPEISQGGLGIHTFAEAILATDIFHKKNGFEIYTQKRYCCITGNHIHGFPVTIEKRQKEIEKVYNHFFPKKNPEPDDDTTQQPITKSTKSLSNEEIIHKLNNAKNAPQFKKLFYDGNCSDYLNPNGKPDESRGDLALVRMFSFYTQDANQIFSLIKQSALYDKKWDRKNYQDLTFDTVLNNISTIYSGIHNEPKASPISTQPNQDTPKKDKLEDIPSAKFPTISNQLCNEYMNIMYSITEAPKSYHFFSFITAVSMLITRHAYIQWGTNEDRIYPNLWTMLVGQTGIERKSSAINKGRRIITNISPDTNLLPMMATWEGLLLAMTNETDSDGNPTDAIKHENTLVCMPEFDGFMKKSRQDQLAHMIPYLCDLYDCPPEVKNTTKGTPLCVPNPFFSILAGIQPEVLMKSFQSNDVHGGFAGRFMYVYDHTDNCIPMPVWNKQNEFNNILMNLAVIRSNSDVVRKISLDDECIPLWNNFYTKYKKLTNNPLLLQLNDRMQIHVLKIATIFACLEAKITISKKHLSEAISIGYWLLDNNAKLFGTIGVTEKANIEAKIIEKLKENPMDKRTLNRSFNGRLSAYDFNSAVDSLLKATLIKAVSVKNLRGKPSIILEVVE